MTAPGSAGRNAGAAAGRELAAPPSCLLAEVPTAVARQEGGAAAEPASRWAAGTGRGKARRDLLTINPAVRWSGHAQTVRGSSEQQRTVIPLCIKRASCFWQQRCQLPNSLSLRSNLEAWWQASVLQTQTTSLQLGIQQTSLINA